MRLPLKAVVNRQPWWYLVAAMISLGRSLACCGELGHAKMVFRCPKHLFIIRYGAAMNQEYEHLPIQAAQFAVSSMTIYLGKASA